MCAHSVCSDPFAAFDFFLRNEGEFFQKMNSPAQGFPRNFFGGRDFSFTDAVQKELYEPSLSVLCSQDRENLFDFKDKIVSGYLNLGKADGWTEGSDPKLGIDFTRYILLKYFIQNKGHLGSNAVVFEKVVKAFKNCKGLGNYSELQKEDKSHQPKESRICYDSSVRGWQKHAVSRLVGNLGTTYSPTKPFFEILINSARYSAEESSCKPFFVSVLANEEEIEKRRSRLVSLHTVPANLAQISFYAPYLEKPEGFLKKNQAKLGPKSTRLLNGLNFLQNVTINAQKVGNCWMKQPMRGLLATLYVELITNRDTLTPAQAWDEAKKLYKNIQKVVAIPLVKDLISQCRDTTPSMKRASLLALDKQTKL